MKKATKLLTVVAMAATLILGAGAFVSCSNSSDSGSSSANKPATVTAKDTFTKLQKEAEDFVDEHEAFKVPDDKKETHCLTENAQKFNVSLEALKDFLTKENEENGFLANIANNEEYLSGMEECKAGVDAATTIEEFLEVLNGDEEDEGNFTTETKLGDLNFNENDVKGYENVTIETKLGDLDIDVVKSLFADKLDGMKKYIDSQYQEETAKLQEKLTAAKENLEAVEAEGDSLKEISAEEPEPSPEED